MSTNTQTFKTKKPKTAVWTSLLTSLEQKKDLRAPLSFTYTYGRWEGPHFNMEIWHFILENFVLNPRLTLFSSKIQIFHSRFFTFDKFYLRALTGKRQNSKHFCVTCGTEKEKVDACLPGGVPASKSQHVNLHDICNKLRTLPVVFVSAVASIDNRTI